MCQIHVKLQSNAKFTYYKSQILGFLAINLQPMCNIDFMHGILTVKKIEP